MPAPALPTLPRRSSPTRSAPRPRRSHRPRPPPGAPSGPHPTTQKLDGLLVQTAGDEDQGVGRGAVEPVCILRDEQERSLRRRSTEQLEGGECDEEGVGSNGVRHTECCQQGLSLTTRKGVRLRQY